MAKAEDIAFDAILSALGLTLEARPSLNLWRWQRPAAAESLPLRPPQRPRARLPWTLEAFELAEKKGTLQLHKLALNLDRAQLLVNLAHATKKYFGPRTHAEFVAGDGGAIWCLFEFTRPGAREKAPEAAAAANSPGEILPHGVAGFSVRLTASGAQAEVVVADYFGFGYVPGNFPSVPLRLAADALGLKNLLETLGEPLRSRSIYELSFPLSDPALAVIADAMGAGADAAKDRLVAVRAALAVPRAPVNSAFLSGAEGWIVRAPAADEGRRAAATDGGDRAFLPLEVLESRERGDRCRPVDQLIQAGKLGQARDYLAQRLDGDAPGLDLLRRLSLVGIAGQIAAAPPLAVPLERALRAEPHNKLFLSFGVTQALEAGDGAAVLALLSRLGAELMGGIRGADELRCFELVLPELLGDAWIAEDRRKAEECYHRVLQKRGELPRILRKLIGLAKAGARPETEIAYLMRLAKVERRHGELAKIFYRLAELRCGYATGRDEAIDLALRSLKLDRAHHRSAMLAAELLVERQRPEEAIQLLDGLLRDPSLSLAPKARSRLEGMIGMIWCKKLQRPDLAELRFEQAAAHDPANTDALRELEALYRQNSNVHGIVGLLERQFDAYERLGDGESLRRVFDELVSLYRGLLGAPKKAYELYQRLLASDAMEPEEIERVLAWRDVEIDWRDLYAKLRAKLPGIAAGERRARYHCRLAEICRERCGEPATAVSHLLDALDDGWIDPNGFTFLVERLTAAKDYPLLVRCFEQRLEFEGTAERRRLTLEFLALPDGLSDPRRDLLAVTAHELDPTDKRAVMGRLAYYQAGDDVDGIDRVLTLLIEDKAVSTFQKNHWLRAGIDLLTACADASRFAILDRLFRQLLASGEDGVAVLQDAIEALKKGPEAKRLGFYVVRLLAAGYLPALEEKTVARLVAPDSRELAVYHQLLSFKATQALVAAQHARTAATLFGQRPGDAANTERMLGRLCALVPVTDADLDQLRGLVAATGDDIVLARALHKQADFEGERGRKQALLAELGHLYWKRLKDLARARLTFGLVQRLAAEPWRVKLILAQIGHDAGDAAGEKAALGDFLADPQAPADIGAMTRAVHRLLELGDDPEALVGVVQPHAEQAFAAGEYERAGPLLAVLLDNDIVNSDLYRLAFRAALATRADELAVDTWWRGLACAPNKGKAKAYIADTRAILEKEGRLPLMLQCLQAALGSGIESRLGPKIRQELLVLLGALLFDTDAKRRRALAVYGEAHGADPDDNRTWMPLYFLLLEFGRPAERLRHLGEIIPRLESDPRPLKSFPITIESLRAELKELRESVTDPLPPPSAPASYDLGDDDDELPASSMLPMSLRRARVPPPPASAPERAGRPGTPAHGEGLRLAPPPDLPAAEAPKATSSIPDKISDAGPLRLNKGARGEGAGSARASGPRDLPALPAVAAGPRDLPAPGFAARPHDLPTPGFAAGPRDLPTPGFAAGPRDLPAPGFAAGPRDVPAPATAAGPRVLTAAGPRDMPPPAIAAVPRPFESGGAAADLLPSAQDTDPDAAAALAALDAANGHPHDEALLASAEQAHVNDDAPVALGRQPHAGDDAPAADLAFNLRAPDPDQAASEDVVLAFRPGSAPETSDAVVAFDLGAAPEAHQADGGFDLGAAPDAHHVGGFALGAAPDAHHAGVFELSPPAEQAAHAADGVAFDLNSGVATADAEVAFDLGSLPADVGAPAAAEAGFDLGPAPGDGGLSFSLDAEAAAGDPAEALSVDFGAAAFQLAPAPPSPAAQSPTFDLGALADAPDAAATGSFSLADPVMSPAVPPPPRADGVVDFSLGDAAPSLGSYDQYESSSVELSVAVSGASLPPPPPLPADGALPPLPDFNAPAAPALSSFEGDDAVTVPHLPSHAISAGGGMSGMSRQGPLGDGDTAGAEGQDDVADWRASVIKGDFNAGLTGVLLRQAFASEIEKHLAIQTVALVAGTCEKLGNWHWRVWRRPEEFGYPLNGKDRYPAGISPQILHSSLHKLVIAIAPLMVKLYKQRFTLDHIARRLEVNAASVERLRKPLAWDAGLLKDAGFGHYIQRIAERRYRAFNMPGLGKEIFYEGGTRSIYLDEAYYAKAPTSHLFHRILGLLWSVRIHYFVPLALHPTKQVMPILAEMHQTFGSQGITGLRNRLKSKLHLSKHMAGLDTRQIKSLYEKVGMPTEDMVVQLWDAMRIHTFRMQIAETLDVIGVFESLLDRDLLKPGVLKHSQLYDLSPYARGLIEFVTKLQI